MSWTTTALASGDQSILVRKTLGAPGTGLVICFGVASAPSLRPSAGSVYSSYSPVASAKYAIVLPSGLHRALRSQTPSVRVRLRGVPCSAGADQTSPRATTATRLPLGEIDACCAIAAVSTDATRSDRRSPGTAMSTARARLLPRSSTWMRSPCCSTISPALPSSGPIAGQRTSCSVKRETCSVFPASTSWLQTLSVWPSAAPRSDRK